MSKPIDLLNAHFDGRVLTDAEAQALSRWVKADAANARLVVELGIIHSKVDFSLSVPRFIDELGDSDDPAVQRSLEAALDTIEIDSLRRQDVAARTPRRRSSGRQSGKRAWVLAAVAASLLGGVFSVLWHDDPARSLADGRLARGEEALLESNAPPPLEPIVATITEAIGVESGSTTQLSRGSCVRRGDELVVDVGVLALTTAEGSDVVVEGPASIVFEDLRHIALMSGRMSARIDGKATGLVVTTPTAKVVDLGTEFGVGIGPDLDTEVAVYEGVVELYGASHLESADAPPMRVPAGRAGQVASDGSVHWAVQTLLNGREFIRPDEVTALREARNGSAQARQNVEFYALQRTRGLMAFQSFDIPSEGASYAIAFRNSTPRTPTSFAFAEDLKDEHLFSSGALLVGEGNHAYLDCDTSSESPLARAKLLTDRGHIGRSGTELWVAWKTKMIDPAKVGDHAGLSLMFGDQRLVQEPLFIGYSGGKPQLSLVSHVGSRAVEVALDKNPDTFSVDPVELDDQSHQWVMQIIFGERGDKVAIWCDVPLAEIRETRPQAETVNANVVFDRFRMGTSAGSSACLFDDIMMATTLDSIDDVNAQRAESSEL